MFKSGTMTDARVLVAVCFVAVAAGIVGAMPADNDKLTLRIIHTNDMHSRFFETSQHSGLCSEADAAKGKCYGGFARIATLVRRIRAEATDDKPVFFLNAGDTYQGTKMFSYYKWTIVARFLNILRPDAVSLGNHEFDDGVEGLIPFLNNASFPIVTANLDLSDEPRMRNTNQLKNSVTFTVKNKKIGVAGYLTPETKLLSKAGNVKFFDEVDSLRKETKKLKSQGCDIIIVVGHSGYEVDKKIGREVEDVDLVIGGHTNTFLYNGEAPDIEKPEGPYPTVVVQPSGRKVYVVQAYAYTKYLGDLSVEFDGNGEITRAEGQPILVDSSIPKAQDIEDELVEWERPVANLTNQIVGSSKVLLQGDEKVCRLKECNLGNLLTDAMIYYNTKNVFRGDKGWTDTPIAVHQAGGIRSSVGSTTDDRIKITMNDILTAFPFGSKLFKVSVGAKTLREMLEWSVNDRLTQNTTSHGGAFLQYSGLQVTYDISKPLKSRLVSVKARCNLCMVPVYEELDPAATYSVLMPDFMHNGGDGYLMLKGLAYQNLNVTMAEVVAQYINQTSPVYPAVEGRIKFILNDPANSLLRGRSSPLNAAHGIASSYVPFLGVLAGFLAKLWLAS